jgi:hypothetical protein
MNEDAKPVLPIANALLFASISAVFARLLTHPLDTNKTILQYAQITKTITPRTFTSYYKGIGTVLFFSIPATTVHLLFTKDLSNPLRFFKNPF